MLRFSLLLLCACGPVGYGMPLGEVKRFAPEGALAGAVAQQAINAINDVAGPIVGLGEARGAVRVTMGGPECGGHWRDGSITVAPSCARFGDDALAVVLVHEVGHAFGLGHRLTPGSVMFPFVEREMTLNQAAASLVDELIEANAVLLPPNAP